MSLLVQLIIGELEFVETDDSVHPMRAEGRGVWMLVETSLRAFFLETTDPV